MQRVADQIVLSCSLFLLSAACALGGDAAARPVFGADLTARLAAYKAGHARLVPQGEGQPFASALCVPVAKQMPHPWDVQMIVQSTAAVAAGDTLSVAFAVRDATGGGHMGVKLADKAGKTLLRQELKPDGVWRKAVFAAQAASAYAPGELTLILFFGQQRQESMIGNATVLACGGAPALPPELAALPELSGAKPVSAPAAPAAPAGPFVMPALPPLDTNTPRFVILKFDDLKGLKNPKSPVHGRFQRLADYIERKGLKASFGIIANTFEENNPAFCAWVRSHAVENGGRFEFWFHGYTHAMDMEVDGKPCKAEFSGPPYAYQSEHFAKGCELMRKSVGFPFRTFGAAGNAVDATGARVLEEHPEIKVCFFAPAQPGSNKLLLARSPELEYAVGKVSFDAFLKGYGGKRTQPYVALQGHPCMWSDEMFADFQHIVELLLADGRTFVTPYEYYQMQGKAQAKR